MEKFFKKIAEIYTVDDFRGHLAVLLGDEGSFSSEEERKEALDSGCEFLKEIYILAQED